MLVLLYFYARFYLMRTFLAFFFVFTFLFGSVHGQRPLLEDPLNGSVHGIGQIAVRWQYSACSTFDLEWDTDSLFQTSQSVQTSRRDTLLPISTPNTYFIRVRCAGNGLFSTAAKFQVVDFGTLGNLKLWLNGGRGQNHAFRRRHLQRWEAGLNHSVKNAGCRPVHLDFKSGRSGWPQQIYGAGIIPQG